MKVASLRDNFIWSSWWLLQVKMDHLTEPWNCFISCLYANLFYVRLQTIKQSTTIDSIVSYRVQVHLWSQENKAHSQIKISNYTLRSQSCFWAFLVFAPKKKIMHTFFLSSALFYSKTGNMSVAFSRHNTHKVLKRSPLLHDDPQLCWRCVHNYLLELIKSTMI